MFASSLALRLQGTGITSYSVHPGCVRTQLGRYIHKNKDWMAFVFPFLESLLWPFFNVFFKSSKEGAQTSIFCAVDDKVLKHNGAYFAWVGFNLKNVNVHFKSLYIYLSDCKPKKASTEALDINKAEKLWRISEKMVDI